MTSMIFEDDDEHADLRTALGRLLRQHAPLAAIRSAIDSPAGPGALCDAVSERMSADLDLAALAVPETYGGLGAPFSFQSVVVEELGRSLVPSSYLPTSLAVRALIGCEDSAPAAGWLREIARGAMTATTSIPGTVAGYDPGSVSARETSDGWLLDGQVSGVVAGAETDLLVLLAATRHGPALFGLELAGPGVARTCQSSIDRTRTVANVVLDAAPAALLATDAATSEIVAAVVLQSRLLLGCEQAALAAHVLTIAADYAKLRTQFGRAIGSFQSIKHLLADRLLDVEAVGALMRQCVRAFENESPEVEELVLVSASYASDTLFEVAAASIQIHGAIGITWEHDAHLYFKRAVFDRYWLGEPGDMREQVAQLLLDTVEDVS